MTLRTTPEQDAKIERLAERWGVSKNEAVLRAVDESTQNDELDAAFTEAYEHVSEKYRDALDRLGNA